MNEEVYRLFAATAAVAAALGFLYSIWKGRADLRRSREVSARAAWEKYLEMAFEHPKLGLAATDEFDAETFEQYEWFVSRMLYAAEEVLLLTNDDRSWNEVISAQIGFHSGYLCGRGASYNDNYSPPLRKLLNKVCAHA